MQNYSSIQKFLHQIVLGNSFLARSLFEIEKSLFHKKDEIISNAEHVFITGLPRSGTTILLKALYETGDFASSTYADMPFVLAPNLFSRFSAKSNLQAKEREQQDGIEHELNSPEAFDEVFFKAFTQDESREELQAFVSLILKKYQKQRYLSKNNLNYQRIELISSVFPNARFLIPFREPLQHAYSLLKQHQHFCKLQKQDSFVLEYMNLLGHHEFGLNHIAWNPAQQYTDPFSLNYWLEQWCMFYQNILKDKSKQSSLVSYSRLCESQEYRQALITELKLTELTTVFKLAQADIQEDYDRDLYDKSNEIYQMLNLSSTCKSLGDLSPYKVQS